MLKDYLFSSKTACLWSSVVPTMGRTWRKVAKICVAECVVDRKAMLEWMISLKQVPSDDCVRLCLSLEAYGRKNNWKLFSSRKCKQEHLRTCWKCLVSLGSKQMHLARRPDISLFSAVHGLCQMLWLQWDLWEGKPTSNKSSWVLICQNHENLNWHISHSPDIFLSPDCSFLLFRIPFAQFITTCSWFHSPTLQPWLHFLPMRDHNINH